MIVKKPTSPRMIEIDLNGPQRNSFFLLGTASNMSKQLGLDGKAIQREMMSDDYENLLQVFDSYFGDYVVLYR